MAECSYYYEGNNYTKEELLDLIKEGKIADETVNELNYTIYQQKALRVLLDIAPKETLEDYLAARYAVPLARVKKYNPNVKFTFNESEPSSFAGETNTVNISLSEIMHMSQLYNISEFDLLNYYIEHELGHAVTIPGMLNTKNAEIVNNALTRARELYKENPFDDKYRGGINNFIDGYPYALSFPLEFLAEHQSNPDFIKWTKSMTAGNTTFWEKLQNFVRSIIGLGPVNSIYAQINDLVNSEEYLNSGNFILSNFPEELKMVETVNANKVWANAAIILNQRFEASDTAIDTLYNELPSQLAELNAAIKQAKLNSKDSKNLTELTKKLHDIQTNEDKVKTIISASQSAYLIARGLEEDLKDLLETEYFTDPNRNADEKLRIITLLTKQAEGLKAIQPTITGLANIINRRGQSDTESTRFIYQLSLISTIKDQIRGEYVKLAKQNTARRFSVGNTDMTAVIAANKELEDYKNKLLQTTDPALISIYNKRIEKVIRKLDLVPTENVIQGIINGELPDATMTDLYAQALVFNGNPMIQSAIQMLNRADSSVAQRANTKNNLMQTIMDRFKKAANLTSLRGMKPVTDKITTKVQRVVEVYQDKTGELKEDTIDQLMFISNYNPEYITKFEQFNAYIAYYEKRRNESKTPEDRVVFNDKLKEYYQARYDFQVKHSERKYKDEYYIHKDLLKEPITGIDENGMEVTTSLQEKYAEIYDRIAEKEMEKRQTSDSLEIIEIAEDLDRLWSEHSEIAYKYTNLGNEKTGLSKKLSEQAIKYREAKKLVGEYKFLDSDREAFEKLKTTLSEEIAKKRRTLVREIEVAKQNRDSNKISLNDFAIIEVRVNAAIKKLDIENTQALNSIQQTKPTLEYYAERKRLQEIIDQTTKEIEAIPALVKLFGGKKAFQDLKEENYTKLAELVRSYRDNEGTIDGKAFTKNKPQSVKIVKAIQEAQIELSKKMKKITGLSNDDNTEYYKLRGMGKFRNATEEARYVELGKLKIELKGVIADHKALFDLYTATTSTLISMSKGEVSSYYLDEVERQKRILKQNFDNEASKDYPKWLADNGLEETASGAITKLDTSGTKTKKTILYPNKLEAIDVLNQARVRNEFEQSPWFINNHYKRSFFVKGSKVAKVEMSPIYIWIEQQPTDDKWKGQPEPLHSFNTFVINDNQLNENYKMIGAGIPMPKQSSEYYTTQALDELKKDKVYYRLHQDLKEFYNQTQEDTDMEDGDRLFDIIPSVPKHNQENKVDATDKLLSGDLTNITKRFWASGLGKVDEDSQLLEGGSISKEFSKNKLIKYRFNNKMDVEKQSYDLFSSLLIYDNINNDVMNKKALEEMFETALAATEDTPRKTTKNVKVKDKNAVVPGIFNLSHMMAKLKNKGDRRKLTEIKEGHSVVHQTLQHMMDTHIYMETKTDAMFTVGNKDIDGHKIVSAIKNISSRIIFALKIFGPTKNYFSSTINGFTQTGLGQGFSDIKTYAKAAALAPIKMKYLLQDYRKIGNKSQFGQAMDTFKVLHGGVHNVAGEKVMWSALGELNGANMAIVKNAAELMGQVTTFLSISMSNPVVINGQEVPFHEAYETVNGEMVPKQGAIFNGKPLNKEDKDTVIAKIQIINLRLNGAFRELEKSKLEKGALGSMAFYLNGFVMPGIAARFGKEEYLLDAGVYTRGYYREGLEFLADAWSAGSFGKVFKTLKPLEQRRVWMFAQEMSVAAFFSIIVALMSMGGGDEKKKFKNNNSAYNWMFAMAMGVGSEIQTFIPLPGLGMDELMRKLGSPFAGVRQIKDISVMIGDLLTLAEYKVNGVKDGFHDKGDLKIVADIIKLTGFKYSEFDATEKLVQIKSFQQLR